MTTYLRPEGAIHCDEHGCCIGDHTVAIRDSVREWKCFNMFKNIGHRLPDSHETGRPGVTPAEVVSSWGT